MGLNCKCRRAKKDEVKIFLYIEMYFEFIYYVDVEFVCDVYIFIYYSNIN